MPPTDCLICDAPAAPAFEWTAHGVDYDGSDAVFPMARMQCATGHMWTWTGEGIGLG